MKFRNEYPLFLKSPDNPSNINWENLEKGPLNIACRVVLSLFFIILILILAMVLNMLLQSFNTNYKKSSEFDHTLCSEKYSDEDMKTLFEKHKEYVDNSKYTEAESAALKADNYLHVNNCYCAQFSSFELVQSNDGKYDYCEKILLTTLKAMIVSIATGIFISVVNVILVLIISKLVLWIHFKSLSTQIAVQILYLTLALLINTLVKLIRWFSSCSTASPL